jgi:hypothetical protein
MTRERFFLMATGCNFLWYRAPGYSFAALSVFSWMAPNYVAVSRTNASLEMSILTFGR